MAWEFNLVQFSALQLTSSTGQINGDVCTNLCEDGAGGNPRGWVITSGCLQSSSQLEKHTSRCLCFMGLWLPKDLPTLVHPGFVMSLLAPKSSWVQVLHRQLGQGSLPWNYTTKPIGFYSKRQKFDRLLKEPEGESSCTGLISRARAGVTDRDTHIQCLFEPLVWRFGWCSVQTDHKITRLRIKDKIRDQLSSAVRKTLRGKKSLIHYKSLFIRLSCAFWLNRTGDPVTILALL